MTIKEYNVLNFPKNPCSELPDTSPSFKYTVPESVTTLPVHGFEKNGTSFFLELTQEQAGVLYSVLQYVSGNSNNSKYEAIRQIRKTLKKLGFLKTQNCISGNINVGKTKNSVPHTATGFNFGTKGQWYTKPVYEPWEPVAMSDNAMYFDFENKINHITGVSTSGQTEFKFDTDHVEHTNC